MFPTNQIVETVINVIDDYLPDDQVEKLPSGVIEPAGSFQAEERKIEEAQLTALDISTLKFLGSGGYSKVYQHKFNTTDAAFKIYHKKNGFYFKRETNFLVELNHRNIIQILSYVNNNDVIWYVIILELASMTLQDYLSKNIDHQRNPDTCKKYASDIVKGVHYLHQQGIAHRDIKPDNILIVKSSIEDRDGIAKLSDFNISMKIEKETAAQPLLPSSTFKLSTDIRPVCLALYFLTTKRKNAFAHFTLFFNSYAQYYPKVPATASLELQWIIHRGLHARPNKEPNIQEIMQIVTDPKTKFREEASTMSI